MENCTLKINKEYARKFEKQKQRAELDRLKQKYGDAAAEGSSSSSDETEDEDAKELTTRVEHDFLKTLSLIKQKDPQIYDGASKFFQEQDESESDGKDESKTSKKPLFLKDYERERLLTKGSLAFVSDDDDSDEEISKRKLSKTYVQEQEELKESFKNALEDDEEDNDFLKVREKTKEQKEKEEEDYIQWLKGEKHKTKDQDAKQLDTLHRYWNDPSLTEEERFLRDFILNKEYLDKDNDRIPTYDEIVQEAEEEKEVEKQEEFERKYNFRFEEPDSDLIKTYPRTVSGSVRLKDNKRTEKRKEKGERKKKEKEKKQEEIKRLKNLKKKEIMEKLDKLKEITGNPNIGFKEDELEGDFDPKKYDEMMQRVFDEDFYNEEEQEKPQFDDEDEIFQDEDWDDWTKPEDEYWNEEEEYNYEDDGNFNMDADYEPGGEKWSQEMERKTHKKTSKLAKALRQKKPLFDPNEKTFEEYFDEYYKLDYEDIIGDQPCRFKYRNVTPNDYGLSTEEIIFCPDRELNQWVSVKKASQYRTAEEEKSDLLKYRRKAKDQKYKKRVLTSLEELETMKQEGEEASGRAVEGSAKKTQLRNFHRRTHARDRFGKRTLHPKLLEVREQSKRKRIERYFRGAKKRKLDKLSSNRLAAYRLLAAKKKKR